MKKMMTITATGLFALAVVSACSKPSQAAPDAAPPPKPKTPWDIAAASSADITIVDKGLVRDSPVTTLLAFYENNRVNGDLKYSGKVLELTGTTRGPTDDSTAAIAVLQITPRYGTTGRYHFRCMANLSDPAQRELVAKAGKDTQIHVKGIVGPYVEPYVPLNGCTLLEEPKTSY